LLAKRPMSWNSSHPIAYRISSDLANREYHAAERAAESAQRAAHNTALLAKADIETKKQKMSPYGFRAPPLDDRIRHAAKVASRAALAAKDAAYRAEIHSQNAVRGTHMGHLTNIVLDHYTEEAAKAAASARVEAGKARDAARRAQAVIDNAEAQLSDAFLRCNKAAYERGEPVILVSRGDYTSLKLRHTQQKNHTSEELPKPRLDIPHPNKLWPHSSLPTPVKLSANNSDIHVVSQIVQPFHTS
jgi:hypothetical protein